MPYSDLTMLPTAQNSADLHVNIVDHPLVRQHLSIMRNKDTDMATFRAAVHSLTPLLVYEATKDLSGKSISYDYNDLFTRGHHSSQ